MPDIWDSIEYRVFPKRHLCAAEVSAVSAVSSGTDMDTADTWQRLGELPAHRSPHTQPALTSSLPAARDTRVKAATDLLLSSLVTSSSPPARVSRLRPSAAEMSGMEASSFSLRKQFGNDLKKEHIFGRKMPQCESKAFFYFLYFTA